MVTDYDGATTATTASIDVLPINDPPVSATWRTALMKMVQLLGLKSKASWFRDQMSMVDDSTASNLSAGDNATVVDNGDGTFTKVTRC
ncbi:cadherin-like domain-containing protein [Vibrio chagasii]|nr:cadherin-like domain-containing protein [Vibrio chagasii]